jgi:isoleucyl-tRNA synthetase
MAISTLLFDRAPFKNAIVLGHVLDKDGLKMSKHKGNVVDTQSVLDVQGADAVRWYFFVNSAPWLPSRFSEDAVEERRRKFMGTLWNTYAFYALYANIDGFNPHKHEMGKTERDSLSVMDKWLLSKLNTLVGYVDECLAGYRLTEPARALADFADEMSNWYVRRCRERFWAGGMERDKTNAYMTLYTALETMSRLIAPFTPFMAEAIYQNLARKGDGAPIEPLSVHLSDFPAADKSRVDKELERNMDIVLDVAAAGRAARNAANIKNRQPIAKMFVKCGALPEEYVTIIKDELNVKSVEITDDVSSFSTFSFKPQLKTLGPKYGRILPKISEWLKNADGAALMAKLKAGSVSFAVDGTEATLTLDDVLYETARIDGFVTETGKLCEVAIDTRLTPELIEEGFVREVVSKAQTMRKEAGFEVLDRICFRFRSTERLTGVITRNADVIMSEILALSITNLGDGSEPRGYSKEWLINGEAAVFSVEKAR